MVKPSSLPPRKKRRKRRFPLYLGVTALIISLSAGVLYAQEKLFAGDEQGTAQPAADLQQQEQPSPSASLEQQELADVEREEPSPDEQAPQQKQAQDREKADASNPDADAAQHDALPEPESEGVPTPSESGKEEGQVVAAESTPSQSPSEAASDEKDLSAFEQEVVQLVNQERTERGLNPLKVDTELADVARTKSEDMRDENYFSHQSPTYGSPFEMMQEFGIQYRAAGENIAAGQTTPQAVVKGWMESEGHRENILNDQFTHIGVGYTKGGSYGHYWTQMFISK